MYCMFCKLDLECEQVLQIVELERESVLEVGKLCSERKLEGHKGRDYLYFYIM